MHATTRYIQEALRKPPIKPFLYREAYELSKSGRLWRKLSGKDCYIFASTVSAIKTNDELTKAYEAFTKGDLTTFKEFADIRFKVSTIRQMQKWIRKPTFRFTSSRSTIAEGSTPALAARALSKRCASTRSWYLAYRPSVWRATRLMPFPRRSRKRRKSVALRRRPRKHRKRSDDHVLQKRKTDTQLLTRALSQSDVTP